MILVCFFMFIDKSCRRKSGGHLHEDAMRKTTETAVLAALLLAVSAPLAAATMTHPATSALDARLTELVAATNSPGASATITVGGRTVWSHAVGFARPDSGTPFTSDTLSSVASVTKLVTAAILTRLAEDGLIDLDAPIAPFVPDTIPGADRVTARQLVDMTAGYPDASTDPAIFVAFSNPNHVWDRAELFARIEEPQFEPGTAYDYSNTNYWLLGQIIDSVYPGGTAAAFRDYIAEPGGLGKDVVFEREAAVVDRLADGYRTADGVTYNVNAGALDLGVNTSVWGTIWTDGGIVATSGGIARFADALYGGVLLNEADTEAARAGCLYDFAARCWSGFIGAFNGYSAFVLHDVERGVTISAVINALDEDGTAQYAFLPGLAEAYVAAEPQISTVPVPGALPLLAAGIGALALSARRRVIARA